MLFFTSRTGFLLFVLLISSFVLVLSFIHSLIPLTSFGGFSFIIYRNHELLNEWTVGRGKFPIVGKSTTDVFFKRKKSSKEHSSCTFTPEKSSELHKIKTFLMRMIHFVNHIEGDVYSFQTRSMKAAGDQKEVGK